MSKEYHVIIEKDEDGVFIGKVPELKGCVTQGSTVEELMKNVKEAIELCLEIKSKQDADIDEEQITFVDVKTVQV